MLIRIENFENDSFPYDMERENRRKSDLKNQTISNLLNQSSVSRQSKRDENQNGGRRNSVRFREGLDKAD